MRGIFAAIVILVLAGTSAQAQTIYPLNRAQILAGAKFDIKVEFSALIAQDKAKLTLNGKDLTDIFGKAPQYIAREDSKDQSTFILRDVQIMAPGTYTFRAGEGENTKEVTWDIYATGARTAKNVILFIGDGMTIANRTAARILSKGITEGKANGMLAMDDMPHMALVSTAAANSISTDSANTATSYTTGVKAPVDALGVYEDRTADPFDNPKSETIAALAREKGMSVGIITDAEVVDATPAAMIAHTRERGQAINIVDQFYDAKPDVLMGGGLRNFVPQGVKGSKRLDDVDYVEKFRAAGYNIVKTATELSSVKKDGKLLGLFADGNMDGALDRKFLKAGGVKDFPDQPDLTDKLQAALDVLSKNDKGFVLLAEAGLIDKYAHKLDMERSVYDTIMLDNGVKLAKEWAIKHGDNTLILVVPDHSHTNTLVGTVNDDMTQMPNEKMRERVGVYEKAGFPNYPAPDAEGYPPRVDVSRRLAIFAAATPDYYETFRPKLDKPFEPTAPGAEKGSFDANPAYKDLPTATFREGVLPKAAASEPHSGDDVILTATGPGSERVHGQMDNTNVFRIMAEALGLGTQVNN